MKMCTKKNEQRNLYKQNEANKAQANEGDRPFFRMQTIPSAAKTPTMVQRCF